MDSSTRRNSLLSSLANGYLQDFWFVNPAGYDYMQSLLCVAICFAFWRLVRLRRCMSYAKGTWLLSAKLTAHVILVALRLGISGLHFSGRLHPASSSMSTQLLLVMVHTSLLLLSRKEHYYSTGSSSILKVCLTFLAIYDIPMAVPPYKTKWTIAQATYVGFLLLTLVLESHKKEPITAKKQSRQHDQTTGITRRIAFLWLYPLFRHGFSEVISTIDFPELSNHRIEGKLLDLTHTTEGSQPQLLSMIWKQHAFSLMLPILPAVCGLFFVFGQAWLLREATAIVSEPASAAQVRETMLLVAAYSLIYGGLAISMSTYHQQMSQVSSSIRAELISLVQTEVLHKNAETDPASESVSLITADIERFQVAIRRMHDTWTGLLAAVSAVWMASRSLDVSLAWLLIFLLVSILLTVVAANLAASYQKRWLSQSQQRISATAQLLKYIKSAMMQGTMFQMRQKLQQLRDAEMHASRAFRICMIANYFASYGSGAFLPVLGFGLHIKRMAGASVISANIDGMSSFAAFALFSIAITGLTNALTSLFTLISAMACVRRIECFLYGETVPDPQNLAYNQSCENSHAENCNLAGIEESFSTLDYKIRSESPAGLNLIIGCTADGRTALLKRLLRSLSGNPAITNTVEPQTAYCARNPWLMNATLRDNIVAFSAFDREWYQSVLKACSLERDIAELPQGDQTDCGNNGVILSGGQKARISLARAVYSKIHVVILDDPFAALDGTIEIEVFQSLFGKDGLLVGAMTVMATSSDRFQDKATCIVHLNEERVFPGSGRKNPAVSAPIHATANARVLKSHTISPNAYATRSEIAGQSCFPEYSPGPTAIRPYHYLLQSVSPGGRIAFIALCAAFVMGMLLPQLCFREYTKMDVRQQAVHSNALLKFLFGAAILCTIAFTGASVFFMLRLSPPMSAFLYDTVTSAVFRKLTREGDNRAPLQFFTTTPYGDVITRFSQDLRTIDDEIPVSIVLLTIAALQIFSQAAVLITASSFTALSTLAIALIAAYIQQFYLRTARQLRSLEAQEKAPLLSHLLETSAGRDTISGFGWQSHFARQGLTAQKSSQEAQYILHSAQNALIFYMNLVTGLLAIAIVTLASVTRTAADQGFGLLLLNVISLSQSAKGFVLTWTSLDTCMSAVARIQEFDATVPPGSESFVPHHNSDWPARGSIHCDGLTTSYSKHGVPALSNVSLYVPAGDKIAVCGRSGSGKSSLISSILGLLHVQRGCITIDNVNLSSVPKEMIRSRLTVIPQEPFFLPASIRENISLYGNFDEQDMVNALEKTGLWTVLKKKAGLETFATSPVLSHIDMRLLLLSIAILRNNSIVIMDELTSFIESADESRVKNILRQHFGTRTLICVAHRLDTIMGYGTVVVMDAGRVIESGCPEVLLKARGSHFAKQYETIEASPASKPLE